MAERDGGAASDQMMKRFIMELDTLLDKLVWINVGCY